MCKKEPSDLVRAWKKEMDAYYHKASQHELAKDIKKAGFTLRKDVKKKEEL